MLATRMVEIFGGTLPTCSSCANADAVIEMHGYAEETASVFLCRDCALQLTRKLLEDLCEVVTGDRHG
jgi:hypothetical protein